MAEYIRKDNIVLHYEGLAEIGPNDFVGIAKYFADQIMAIPAADVALVRHGTPTLGMRMERFEVYDPVGMLDGEEVFKRRIITEENSSYMRCPFCGKRLCSRFFNYCPNCGAKMDEGVR